MKIALVHQPTGPIWTPGTSGSVSIWLYEVARRLARSCNVVVYARRGMSQPVSERYEGVEYRRISVAADEALLALLGPLARFRSPRRPLFASTVAYLKYIVTIAANLRRQGCDVIHVHGYPQFVPIVHIFNPRTPIVLHMHGEWLTQLDPDLVEHWTRHADLIIGVSEYVTDKIRRRFPHLAPRCHTIHMGVDTDRFDGGGRPVTRDAASQRLLYVGRISPEKGLHLLLDAFAVVARRYENATLKIVGPEWLIPKAFFVGATDDPRIAALDAFYDGSYLAHLRQRLPESLIRRVTFVDLVVHDEVHTHFLDADLYVNPSFTESLGMSIIEAMASRLPVVATSVGGVPEVVESGRTGLLVDAGNAGALAEGIIRLFGDDRLRLSLAAAGYSDARTRFSWDRITENVMGLYENLLNR
jgi:glycosyltransferase involved in cell wall biosynthesis